jgi:hypothetical protein
MTHKNRSRLTVNPKGDWRSYVDAVPHGFEPRGTVQCGEDEPGALLFCPATGKYIQANGGTPRQLDQRKVKAALGITNNAGRPETLDGGKRVNVYLDSASLAKAAELGSGNVSEGIRIALKKLRESQEHTKAAQ